MYVDKIKRSIVNSLWFVVYRILPVRIVTHTVFVICYIVCCGYAGVFKRETLFYQMK